MRESCQHSSHVVLNKDTVCKVYRHKVNPSAFWGRSVCVAIEDILNEPVRFQYGTSCFSDLVAKAQQCVFPSIPSILSVGSGEGFIDFYIASAILGAEIVHLTDLEPPNDLVERLSCLDAVAKYGNATALMFTFPCFYASGYERVIEAFKGNYVVLVGEIYDLYTGGIAVNGHTDPGDLLEQIVRRFEEVVRFDINCYRTTLCLESMVVYRRKENV